MTTFNNRLPWIDTLKGIAISLVVLGHAMNTGPFRNWIYLFHIPLFFLLSGYLHKPVSNLGVYARRKAKHLLLPYVCFTIVATVLWFAHALHQGITNEKIRENLVVILWGGNKMRGNYGVLWFLTCLFLTQQIMNWLVVRCNYMLVGGLVFLALCLSYVNSIFYPNFSLPLDANVVLAAMPFFFVGFLCRRRNLDGWRLVAFGASGLTISAYLVLRNVSISIDMREGVYGVPLLSPLLAIGCASFCTSLSKVASSRFVGEPLRRLGELSMGIMFIHKEIEDLPGYALLERTSSLLAFMVSLTLSFALSYLVSRFSITRAFLLGSEADIESLGQSANAAARS